MRKERLLLFPLIFLLLSAGSACALSISQYYDSDGKPVSAARETRGPKPSGEASRYAVPDGIELHRDISYEYYPVFGKSFSEAVKSAEENGPFVKSLNRQATSKIDWRAGFNFQYDYHYDIDEESRTVHATIEVSDVAVKYDITITMPALLDDTALGAVEKKLWRSYFQRLLELEHGRAAIVQDKELKEKLESDIRDIRGIAFDYTGEGDIEGSIELFVKEESAKIGQGWIKKINERLNEYNLKTGRSLPRRRRRPVF